MGTKFPALFRKHILRTGQIILARLEALGDAPLSADVRELALHNLPYLLDYADAWPYASRILVQLAPKLEQEGHRDAWLTFLARGIQRSKLHHDLATAAELQLQLGILYQFLGKFDGAVAEFSLSLAAHENLGASARQAKVLNRLAYVERLQRRYDEATHHLAAAQTMLDADDAEWAYTYFVQGAIALDQGAWAQAESLFRQSLYLWEQQGEQRMIAWSWTNVGTAVRRLARYDEAIDCYTRAIAIFDAVNDVLHKATASLNLGNVYEALGQYEQAHELYMRAEVVFRELQDDYRLAIIYTNIGIVHRHLKNWAWSRMSLLDAIERWQLLGNTKSATNATMELGLLYMVRGQYEHAITKFHVALNWLGTIKGEPGHKALLDEVTAHLEEAQANKAAS